MTYSRGRSNINIEGKTLNILFLLTAIFIYSQKYPLKYGVKGGWNYSVVNAVDEIGQPSGYISGIIDELYGGFALEKQITQKSYLQSGLLISYTDAITFVELPIFYKYNFYRKFSLLAGTKIEFIPDEQNNQFIYFKRRVGFSLNFGIDYQIFKNFLLEGYFSKAFVKQFDDNILGFYDSKRNVYRIGLTYFIN